MTGVATPAYLDADILLALIKEDDRHKTAAIAFFRSHQGHAFVTSSITCLEIWFYLNKQNLKTKALDAIRAISQIATIVDYGMKEMEGAIILAEHHKLSPADAIHALMALRYGKIISSDGAFDRIQGLQRIDFSTGRKM